MVYCFLLWYIWFLHLSLLAVVVQVISTLKQITLREDRNGEQEQEEEEERETSSLDRPGDRVSSSPRVPPRARNGDEDHAPPPSVSVDPSMLLPSHTTANSTSLEEE